MSHSSDCWNTLQHKKHGHAHTWLRRVLLLTRHVWCLLALFTHLLACVRRALQAVSGWQAKLESVEPDVQRVMAEEREETALRKAEMEANKAQVGGQGAAKHAWRGMVCMHA